MSTTLVQSAVAAIVAAAFSKATATRDASRAIDAIHACVFPEVDGYVTASATSETLATIAKSVRDAVIERNKVAIEAGMMPANPDSANGTVKALAAAVNKVKKALGPDYIFSASDVASHHKENKLCASAWRAWAIAHTEGDTTEQETNIPQANVNPVAEGHEIQAYQPEALTADIAALREYFALPEGVRLSECINVHKSDVTALRCERDAFHAERDALALQVAALTAQLAAATAKKTRKAITA